MCLVTEQLQPQHQLAATKLCEPRSQMLKDVYAAVVNDDDKSLKAVQKLPINTTAERDYSAQETCHLLLQLPMFMASRDFIILCPCAAALRSRLRTCKLGLRARSFCSLLSFSTEVSAALLSL